jgi:hypothetical protein
LQPDGSTRSVDSQAESEQQIQGFEWMALQKKRKEKKRGLLVITATGRQAVEPAGGLQGRIHTLGDAILPFLD